MTKEVSLTNAQSNATPVATGSLEYATSKAAEVAKHWNPRQWNQLLAAACAGTWRCQGDLLEIDGPFQRLLGRANSGAAIHFSKFVELVHPEDRGRLHRAFAALREGDDLNVEFRIVTDDGAFRWLRGHGSRCDPADNGLDERSLCGACIDITKLKETEAALQEANRQVDLRVAARTAQLEGVLLRKAELTRLLTTAQEDEQRRLSRELHDSVGQLLAGLSLTIKAARLGGELPRSVNIALAEAHHLVDLLSQEVHALAVRIRPQALDDIGLEIALRQHVHEWSRQTGIRADFHAAGLGSERLDTQIETAVYRIVREALTNVAKHANAMSVSVVLRRSGGEIVAMIEDDGQGFDPEEMSASRLGLIGMRERAALLDGEIDLESRPEGGTTIVAHIPVSKSLR